MPNISTSYNCTNNSIVQYGTKNEQKIMRPQYQTKLRPLGKVIQFNHPNPHPIYSNNAQNEYSNDAMKIFSNSVGGRPKDYRLSFGATSRTSR